MHYLEIIEVAANYLSYLNFDLFSRMSTKREYVSNSILFFLSLYPSVFKVLSGAAHPTGNSRALTIAFLIDRVFGIHRRVK